jgi:hypothetical protein
LSFGPGGRVEKNQFISVLAHLLKPRAERGRERNLRFGHQKIINKAILPSDVIIVSDAELFVEYYEKLAKYNC